MKEAFLEVILKESGHLTILGKLFKISIIITVSIFLVKLIKFIMKIVVNKSKIIKLNKRKRKSIANLIYIITKYIICFIAGVLILETFNINTNSILAAAGISGLAIGFGAQSLIKDLITGFFILIEDQFSMGDYIVINSFEGTVINIGIRATTIKSFTGEIHTIPNSSITTITNKSKSAMTAKVSIYVPLDEDVSKLIKKINKTFENYKNKKVIDVPTVLGVTNIDNLKSEITIIAKTIPMAQWDVERDIRKILLKNIYSKNVEVPHTK